MTANLTALAHGQGALILPEPRLMGLSELCAYHRSYAVRLAAHLTGHGRGLSEDERGHAHEVEREYREWKDSVRWTYARP